MSTQATTSGMENLLGILQAIGYGGEATQQQQTGGNYPDAWSGLAAGMMDYQKQERAKVQADVEGARQNVLNILSQIPDSEQNTPLKFKLMLDVLNAKPGASHWSDKLAKTRTQGDEFIGSLYKMINGAFPNQQSQAGVATAPDGQQVSARPRIANTDTMVGSGLGAATAGDPRTGAVLSGVESAPQPGKFAFTDPGKWKDVNEVFQDEATGNKYLMQIDQTTGKTKRIDLGKAKTVAEIREELRTQRYQVQKKAAVDKKYYEAAIGLSGLGSEELFEMLPQTLKEQYLTQAAQLLTKDKQLNLDVKQSTIERNRSQAGVNQATVPLRRAQTENTLAQPKDPNAVTTDEARTAKELTTSLDQEIKLRDRIINNPDSTRAQIKQAREERTQLIRQRDNIRNKILNPEQKLQNYGNRRPAQGTIPKGTSGPTGATPNDPEGLLPYIRKRQ